uniref:Raftlin, lipid raft linker 1 n=1 Tax=Mustela putorius furo TaxID=9669 RepID=M3XQW4_MUSPF
FASQVQEAASQGLKFVGVIPQYGCPAKSAGSSPPADTRAAEKEPGRCREGENPGLPAGTDSGQEPGKGPGGETPIAEQPTSPSGEGDGAELSPHGVSKTLDGPDGDLFDGPPSMPSHKMEILALFNKPKSHQKCRQYYPVSIPLRVSKNGQTVSGLDANWLEHMSDHFRKGGMLVNAVFYLGMVNDSFHGLTDGVFIFEAVATEDSKTMQGYDAIVVEQWTVLEGVEVQTDYVPLLNSLAAYGWQLTCVLPTPVVKTTRDGNVSTKQIVFLQRPCLPQKIKKKESKKLLCEWGFQSKDMHSRQMRKSKGKLSARDKRQAEENEKNLEDQFSKAGDVGNCVPGPHQDDEASEEVTEGKQHPDSLCVEGGAVQNGPAGPCRAPTGGCTGHSHSGEDAREGDAGEVAAEPSSEDGN